LNFSETKLEGAYGEEKHGSMPRSEVPEETSLLLRDRIEWGSLFVPLRKSQ